MGDVTPQPFFFGRAARRKFGCYDGPVAGPFRQTAMVLCYPFGHEYVRAHRSYRRLARALTESGFPVLRFDYSGCGDSAGGGEAASLEVWTQDLQEAIDAIHARCSATSLCLIGGRLGGAIALRVAGRREDVQSLALWDPVLSGPGYLRELERDHREMVASAHVTDQGRPAAAGATEIMGFLLPDRMRQELEEDPELLVAPPGVAGHVLLLDSFGDGDQDELERRLTAAGATVARSRAEGEQPWTWAADVARAVLPVGVIQSIVSWAGEHCP
jgi:pimeloyl-ACP methyl ester carboxylesterase